jgi:C4-dicarboxylate transporter
MADMPFIADACRAARVAFVLDEYTRVTREAIISIESDNIGWTASPVCSTTVPIRGVGTASCTITTERRSKSALTWKRFVKRKKEHMVACLWAFHAIYEVVS